LDESKLLIEAPETLADPYAGFQSVPCLQHTDAFPILEYVQNVAVYRVAIRGYIVPD